MIKNKVISAVIATLLRPDPVGIKRARTGAAQQSVPNSASAAKQPADQSACTASNADIDKITVPPIETRSPLPVVIRSRLIVTAVVVSFVISTVIIPTLVIAVIGVAVIV